MSKPLEVRCGAHGKRVASVVCGHMLAATDRIVGFVENSSEPDDLQAWCDDCEAMFVEEDGMTARFRRFVDMSVVCVVCYARLKERHTRLGTP